MELKSKNYVFRIGNGENFNNSGYHNYLWGISSENKGLFTILKKIKKGDILWFSTKKGTKYDGKVIAVAEFDYFLNRDDDENLKIKYSNQHNGWKGDKNWNILIFFKNLYDIRKQDIKVIFSSSLTLFTYETYVAQCIKREKKYENLELHYENIKFYSNPYSDVNKEKILLMEKINEQEKNIQKLEEIIEINNKKLRDVMTRF